MRMDKIFKYGYSPSCFTTFSHFFFHVLGQISRVGFPNARA